MSDKVKDVANAIRQANAGEYMSDAVAELCALAAINALREPSKAMIEAGTERDDGADPTNAIGVYQAMNNAALSHKEPKT